MTCPSLSVGVLIVVGSWWENRLVGNIKLAYVFLMYFTIPDSLQNGLSDCVINISMSENSRVIPPGIIVCLKCSVRDGVAADATFQIDNFNIDENTGRVVDGVLVLFDTKIVFTTAKHVQCMSISLNVSHSILMSLNCKSYYTE